MQLLGRSCHFRRFQPFLLLAVLGTLLLPSTLLAKGPNISGGAYDRDPRVVRYKGGWYSGTLSGTFIRQSMATTSWYLYPGACADRAANTWAPKTSQVADSLNTYSEYSTDSYTTGDQSLNEKLWHVADASTPSSQRPAIISGSRSLWCGKYQPGWALPVGYPNQTYQILYIDTGTHGSNYNLTLDMNVSAEQGYDFLYLVGGGGLGQTDHADPLTNRRDYLDDAIGNGVGGPYGDSDLLVSWTGSITTPSSVNTTGGAVAIVGSGSGSPATVSTTITIASDHRALYFVFVSDYSHSSQDGLWPSGKGAVFDNVAASDNGSIYTDQTAVGGTDAFSGSVILGTPSNPIVSARVPAGVGDLWLIRSGTSIPTADACSPQKDLASERFFFGGDGGTLLTIPGTSNSIVTCTFPIPAGTASIQALWNEYLDLPRGSGFVQLTEYRYYKGGLWSDWRNTSPSNAAHAGGIKNWVPAGDELTGAAQADSVQIRYDLICVPSFSTDKVHCQAISRGLLYDDLRLEVTTGVPYPLFGLFAGSAFQTTFVDGTMTGTNCASPPCWPGVRGTDLGAGVGINDNVNAPTGDSLVISLHTGLRQNGMGMNWKQGFDKSVSGGLTIAHTNGAYNSAYDQPRMIFRLWDPTTKTWSAFDSTALDADAVTVGGSDTSLVHSAYRVDWPPRDKVLAGASLPGGFTINGVASYSALAFLPRGTRLQYYFKAIDINGGTAYQFSPDSPGYEVADLPTLPGGSAKAPDIIQFEVLPGVYPAGPGGTLLAGRTNTPVLNLDGTYTSWSFQQDPVTQALRGLGVRADRYRFFRGYDTGSNVGGHELPGNRIGELGNFFPNLNEYSIKDSLASWYRILIQSSHVSTFPVCEEEDAKLVIQWWNASTGTNGGDRCIFGSGDDFFNMLFAAPPATEEISLAQDVFGVASQVDAWSGTPSNAFPTIDDRFAAPSAGPALAAPATFTYPVDGGCAGKNRFDGLVKIGSADAANSAFYPSGSEVAGVARMSEKDASTDNDRSKALGYGFSIQFIRKAGIPTTASSYVHSGVENRMQVLYKFLASCRGARTGAPGDTGKCWPCPTDANLAGNWAALSGFATGMWGPLYPIQDPATATGVEEPAPGTVPLVNALLQNRPNPFNPETTIPYALASPGRVVIRVFDISGRRVATLVDRVEREGPHAIRWNGSAERGGRVASGVYFYKIEYPDGSVSAKKLTMLR